MITIQGGIRMSLPQQLLNRPVACSCGQTHVVPIERVVVGEDMLDGFHQYAAALEADGWLVVADANTHPILGKAIVKTLADGGRTVHTHVFAETDDLLPDRSAIAAVQERIRASGASMVVAVGSGVINDITRYASFCEGRPYLVVATASSMDGYASSVAALQFDGLKTTLPAHPPKAIFADPRVLSAAPWELIQAGFGDLVGKAISLLDWKLARVLYGEPFCDTAYQLVCGPLRECVERVDRLKQRDPETIQSLFVGLVNAGVAMAMVGNSRPCSGSEHHCSHYWDLLAYKGRRTHASHGHQVGYATGWMMRFYRLMDELEDLREPRPLVLDEAWVQYVDEFYGEGAQTVLEAQRRKQAWLEERHRRTVSWRLDEVRAALEPEFSWFPEVEQALTVMGLADSGERLEVDAAMLRETFHHAWELRDRYTIFDFLIGQDCLERALERLLG
jgi:glycerol-1-phosphate dehydrogenase [NAD(P)+]